MNVGNIKFESEIKRKVRKDFFEIIENILRFAKTLRQAHSKLQTHQRLCSRKFQLKTNPAIGIVVEILFCGWEMF